MSHRRLLDWKQKSPNPNTLEDPTLKIKTKFSDQVFTKSRSALSNAVLKIPQFLFNPTGSSNKDYLGFFGSKRIKEDRPFEEGTEKIQTIGNGSNSNLGTVRNSDAEEPEELKNMVGAFNHLLDE